jgi:uncharacterized FlaG/YvyC family protein
MDTGLNIRPVLTSSSASVRVEPAAERQVARTELPQARVVSAPAESRNVQFDRNDQQQKLRAEINTALDVRAAAPQKKVDLDETTQELIFRTVSAETGLVVSQYPDDALLRQRAYSVQQRRAELRESSEAPLFQQSPEKFVKVA